MESAPEIVKKCMSSVRKVAQDCGYDITVITKDNYSEYISIPQFILDKVDSGAISITHLSDYIRVALSAAYGRGWIDATCYFTGSIPHAILESPFFQFRVPGFLLSDDVDELQNKIAISGSSWFLFCRPGNRIVVGVKKALERYWRKEVVMKDYFLFHYILSIVCSIDEKCRQLWLDMPYYPNDLPHLLQKNMSKKYNSKVYSEIQRLSFVHKLTYKNVPTEKDTYYAHIRNGDCQ